MGDNGGYTDGGSYSFHFPDGNASIARLLIRNLVPAALPGRDARDGRVVFGPKPDRRLGSQASTSIPKAWAMRATR